MLAALLVLPFAAAFCATLVALATLLRPKRSPAGWLFFAGMLALGVNSLFTGLSVRSTDPGEAVRWLSRAFAVESALAVIWIGFGQTYSRGNYQRVRTWGPPAFWLVALVAIGASLGFADQLFSVGPGDVPGEIWQVQFGPAARAFNLVLLLMSILILMNLEQTFRSSVGTMRWRIKFVMLGLAIIFGARLYVRSQVVLFSSPAIALWGLESGAVLIGCVFLGLAYARTSLVEIDVYPSRAFIRSSLTLLISGGYLLVVGALAGMVSHFGGPEAFQLQALVVLLGLAGLGMLLLSDRVRVRLRAFVARHFSKAQHDSVRIWTSFSRQFASVTDRTSLARISAASICETFEVLSVTVWLVDSEQELLVASASTEGKREQGGGGSRAARTAASQVIAGLRTMPAAFDLESVQEPWAGDFRHLNPSTFPNGGTRLCLPMRHADEVIGCVVVADRVGAAEYTHEEIQLLKCIADQMASVLVTLELAGQLARARELEAFRTMSAFFVHDLKNAATSLKLTLQNLPQHYDDPAFREDALRGISNTTGRIESTIARLSAIRERIQVIPETTDLNELVSEALEGISAVPNIELTAELQPLPLLSADREQMRSVITNLVLNAQAAISGRGSVQVRTEHCNGHVVLSVADSGCGMTAGFVKESLFRPFQSTKKNGLGIGLFQSRAIVQAHGGGMRVQSEPGKGTTFLVTLPARNAK
jgi:putative PEP-CTERM system histidine kinase